MRHKTTLALYSYWNQLRGDRVAPRRFDVEPSRIGPGLQDTFILERNDRSTYSYRLAGTRICERFGIEFRGRNFLDDWSESDRLTLERHLEAVTQRGGVGLLTLEAGTQSKKETALEVLLLPLIHGTDTIERILGSISILEEQPWIGTERLETRRLLTAEVIWPDGRPHALIDRMSRQSPFLPHVRTARIVRQDRRQFRVYDGGLSKSDGDPV